jgi:hypothetical protein
LLGLSLKVVVLGKDSPRSGALERVKNSSSLFVPTNSSNCIAVLRRPKQTQSYFADCCKRVFAIS